MMESKNSEIHPLVKGNFTNRVFGAITITIMALSAVYPRSLSGTSWGVLGFFCLAWPYVAYTLAKQSQQPNVAETRNLLVDPFFMGYCIGMAHFDQWVTAAVITGIIMNLSSSGGSSLLLKGFAPLCLGGTLAAIVEGVEFKPESSLLTMTICVLSLFTYVAGFSNILYRSNRRFLKTSKHLEIVNHELEGKKEQMEALAHKLSKYLSPQVYEVIFSGEQDVKIETHQKRLTVFFSDIVEFTVKSEKSGTHELVEWLNSYLNEMANVAIRYDGTLDKFIGDSVMVFFGDPQTSGEKMDAIRCVMMAMEMREQAKLMGTNIRIGIHTGDCIVGNFGSEQRMEYTIIGGTVNLAARLEANSKPNEILISDSTYELVKDFIRCEPRGEIRVKGIDRDIMTYWVGEYDRRNIENVENGNMS